MPYSPNQFMIRRARAPKLIGLMLLAWWVPIAAWAQVAADQTSEPSRPSLFFAQKEGLRFERFSVDEGLSQSGALQLAQDAYGFLWIGTNDGLNKFDGHDFTVYVHDPAEPRSLPNNAITALHVDREGTLWVGTRSGLAKLVGAPSGLDQDGRPLDRLTLGPEDGAREQAVFVTYVPHPVVRGSPVSGEVTAIKHDDTGQLWIGSQLGLDRFDPESGVFTHIDHDPTDPVPEGQNVFSILVEDDIVWAGGRASGLKRLDTREGGLATYPPALIESTDGVEIRHMLRTRSGELWVGGEHGFGLVDEDAKSLRLLLPDSSKAPGHSDNLVNSMLEDRQGTIWVGTQTGGLVRYHPQTGELTHYRHNAADPASLGRAEIFALLEDHTGILWVGTGQGGLSKAVRRTPAFVSRDHDPTDPRSISHNYITAISEGASGDIWIGTGGGGLNLLEARTGRFRSYRSDPDDPHSLVEDYVRGVLEDRQGVLWVTTSGALHRLAPGGEAFSVFKPGSTLTGSIGRMTVIYEDRAGRLWVGSNGRTVGGGTVGVLLRFDRETEAFERVDLPEADRSIGVQAIYEDRSGTLWLGTEQGGLYAYDPTTEHLEHYGHEPADGTTLRHATVQSIYQDSRSALWIGTRGGGLSRLEPDGRGFRHYSQSDGLANDVVYCIVEDHDGLLWLSTNRGLSRLDPVSGVFRNYDVTDGLQSNEFNRWACLMASDGTLFFGGINGLTFFRLGSVGAAARPPPVALTSVSVRNQVVATGKTAAELTRLELPANQNFFSLDFVALDFGNSAQNQYSYRLVGFDDDWIQAGSRRFARYTNVVPGEYEFRLRAANNEGVWNEEGLSLAITVLPPFWATWWFIFITVATGVLIVYGLYRYRVTQLIRVERTRTRIARDLHDDLSATLTSISFFAHAMRNELEGRGEASKLLGLITNSAGEARETVHDIVWSINPEHDSWESLLAHCRRFASDLLASCGIDYELEIPQTPAAKPLSAEQRQDFWLTYKELLTNVSRHARCSTMRIRLSFPRGAVRLDMSDDGVGFDEEAVIDGHGLRNVRARAARLRGSLDLRTSPGAGTHWRLEFRP